MATAISAIGGFSTSLCCVLSPPPRKGKEGSLSLITRRSCTAAAGRLSCGGAGKRMPNFSLFSSNSDQQPEEAEGAELLDEVFLPRTSGKVPNSNSQIPDAFHQRVLLTGRFLICCLVVLVAEAMPTGYSPKIHFRCRASTFRQVCDRLLATFGEEFVNALRLLQLDQFLLMPAFKQNVPLVHMLLTKWNVKKQCFVIKGKNIPFTAEEVAMITGLPNRGADFVIGNGRISGVTANDLRHEIDGMKRSTPLKELLEKFIVYLLSNLFFPLANFRVPSSILTVAENAEEFLMYNWPASIRQFLVAEFDSIAEKHRKNTPLGYINGFVIILIIWFLEHSKVVDPLEELSRRRFVRWDSQIMYSEKDVLGLFKEVQYPAVMLAVPRGIPLRTVRYTAEYRGVLVVIPIGIHQSTERYWLWYRSIAKDFQGITEQENALIHSEVRSDVQTEEPGRKLIIKVRIPKTSSPPTQTSTPPTQTSPIPTQTSPLPAQSPARTPQSPSPPPDTSSPAHTICTTIAPSGSPPDIAVTSTPQSTATPTHTKTSPPPPIGTSSAEKPTRASSFLDDDRLCLAKDMARLISQNKMLLKKISKIESNSMVLERRVAALEHELFERKDQDKKLEDVMMFLQVNFPNSFKTENVGDQAEHLSRTPTADVTDSPHAEEPVVDVEEPAVNVEEPAVFAEAAMLQQVDKIIEMMEETIEEEPSAGIAGRVRQRSKRKRKSVRSPYTTGKRKTRKKIQKEPPAVVPLHEQKDESPPPQQEKSGMELVVVPEDTQITYVPAPKFLDFPGRNMISEYKCSFIDGCLAKFHDKNDAVYNSGNVVIYRSQIDELLTSEYLDNNYVDAAAIILSEKNSLAPGLYQPFLYVSSFHWSLPTVIRRVPTQYRLDTERNFTGTALVPRESGQYLVGTEQYRPIPMEYRAGYYHTYDYETSKFVSHINKESVKASKVLLINHFYQDTEHAFGEDIRQWPVRAVVGVPVQSNSVDCGVFVCKYMEAAIQPEAVVWPDQQHWAANMPKYRAELAYAILCATIK
ncbi:hypothetical protein M5K25_006185 [Dendrobium thyrsiflorum]|uniref:Ubiquitin-like protease family profile domain-containing protein n=1 Tax=Dendrobium thyrsiflorum TaxID=117978 RepID=A0ABD0VAT7_DENTH